MTTQTMHLATASRRFMAGLLLTVAVATTACGSGLAAQAAAAAPPGSAEQVASETPLPARGVAGSPSTAQQVTVDAVAGADAEIYRVGQTAAVGALRVTLDSVAVSAGAAGSLPDAGHHFLIVNITVENTAPAAHVLPFFFTRVSDMAGRDYFVEPRAGPLSTAPPLRLSLPPAGRVTFSRGYMLPVDAGDVTWTAEDAGHNRVMFAIGRTSIVERR